MFVDAGLHDPFGPETSMGLTCFKCLARHPKPVGKNCPHGWHRLFSSDGVTPGSLFG